MTDKTWKPVKPGTIECDCDNDCGSSVTVEDGCITLENEAGYWSVELPEQYAVCERVPDNRLRELSVEVDSLRQQVADLHTEYATQQAIHNAGLEHIEKAQVEAYDDLVRLRALLPSAATRNALRRAMVDAGWSRSDNAHVWAWLERLERP